MAEQNPKPSEGGTPPEGTQAGGEGGSLTQEQVNALVVDRVNAAFSAHGKRLRDVVSKDVEGLIKSGLSPVLEELGALKAAREAAAEPPKGGDQTAQSVEAAVAKARAKDDARIRELEAKAAAAEQARAESEHTRLQQEERTALSQALSEAGIEGVRVKHALSYLKDEKKIGRNEKGEVCYKMVRAYGDELVTLKDGLAEWLKTEDGKSFLPPRGVGGSGAQAGKAAGKGGNSAQGKAEAANAKLFAALGYKEE